MLTLLPRVRYFKTSVPGAGIFLPIHRAERRSPASASADSPSTPSYSTYSTYNGNKVNGRAAYTPPTPAMPSKFSQSVGPGARPSSPMFKPKRPSLPRPESPLRRQPNLAPTPARPHSQSQRGGRAPLSHTPSKSTLKSSTSSRTPAGASQARPYSRAGSRMGSRSDAIEEDEKTPTGVTNGRTIGPGTVPSFSQPLRSPSRLGSAGGHQDAEVQRLRSQLAERDSRLNEQAASLAEMENSVRELSALMPTDGVTPGGRSGSLTDDDERTAGQLRQMLREKNEKISKLTAEFDAHRADFRSTLDSLEMASTETERVYEEQKRDLLAQVAELQEVSQSREDFEGVARQLKQLEELVAELEEGLEESRRGEAEARGEVEFLRGEVERGRSELRREREKAAAALKHASTSSGSSFKDMEQRDDEIRGLKAIIHSFSEGGGNGATVNGGGSTRTTDPDEIERLHAALDESRLEKESLEGELEQLRRDGVNGDTNGHAHVHARKESQMTEKALPSRARSNTVKATGAVSEHGPEAHGSGRNETVNETGRSRGEAQGETASGTFCEMCESDEHDTMDCTKPSTARVHAQAAQQQDAPASHKPGVHVGKENEGDAAAAEAETGAGDEDKWCALCEKDGHLAFDCPEEQY